MESPASGGVTKCPKCAVDVADGEKFCAACGAGIGDSAGIYAGAPPPMVVGLDFERDAKIGRARKWLLWISGIIFVSGLIFYAINKSEVEKQIREVEQQIAGVDPVQRDTLMKQETGMTWAEAVAHDRGQVTLQLAINIGLAILYIVLWFWAKKNPLGATVTALLLFVTVIGISAVYDPKTLAQGIIVKIFFIAALAKAISAAHEERQLQARLPRATAA